MKFRILFLSALMLGWIAPVLAAPTNTAPEKKPVTVTAYLAQTALTAGSSAQILVVCDVPIDMHLTNHFNELMPPAKSDFTFSAVTGPKGEKEEDEIIYHGKTPFLITISAPNDLKPGSYDLELTQKFQSCLEQPLFMCYAPESKTVKLPIKVVAAGAAIEPANSAIFAELKAKLKDPQALKPFTSTPIAPAVPETTTATTQSVAPTSTPNNATQAADLSALKAAQPPTTVAKPTIESRIEQALQSGSIVAFLLIFAGGFLTSLTPCVYPMIPITISYIGGRAKGKFHGFYLSLFFVLGIAIMYSTLGIFAASTGALFGNMLQNPIAISVVAGVFAAMGASMLGAFDLVIPASLQTKLQSGAQKGGLLGAVFMGMVTGIVASPCVGPVLVVLLTWVAKTGNIPLGFSMLFVFALGMGVLFILLGTFSGAMSSLPQAGHWMETIKHLFGVILLGMAIYYLSPLLSKGTFNILVGALLIFFGTFSGAFKKMPEDDADWGSHFSKSLGIIGLTAGIFYLVFGLILVTNVSFATGQINSENIAVHKGPAWVHNEAEGLQQAKAQGKPVLIDFYADWCAACVELDEKTWVDDAVRRESERFVTIKMDFTDTENSAVKDATNRYNITGMPTVIFMDNDGREVQRFVGFKPAGDVLALMQGIGAPK